MSDEHMTVSGARVCPIEQQATDPDIIAFARRHDGRSYAEGRAAEVAEVLPHNLKHFRKLAKMTQEDVSKVLGVGTRTVQGWEAGESEPTAGRLATMATLYGVTTDLLCGIITEELQAVIDRWTFSTESQRKAIANAVVQYQSDKTLSGTDARAWSARMVKNARAALRQAEDEGDSELAARLRSNIAAYEREIDEHDAAGTEAFVTQLWRNTMEK